MLNADRKHQVSLYPWAETLTYTPVGWFAVCRADELAPDGSRIVELADREILLARGSEGRIRGYYAYCPHQGVRFGTDSKPIIRDSTIRCPFHDFQFDPNSGACVAAYACKRPKTSSLDLIDVPVGERDGWIFAAHGLDMTDPANHFDLWFSSWPEIPGLGAAAVCAFPEQHAHPQEIFWNGFDETHFKPVHGMDSKVVDSDFDRHVATLELDMDYRWKPFPGVSQQVVGRSVANAFGLGVVVIDSVLNGVTVRVQIFATPRSAKRFDYYGVSRIGRLRPDGGPRTLFERAGQRLAAELSARHLAKSIQQDLSIIGEKFFVRRPKVCANRRLYDNFATWTEQFRPSYRDSLISLVPLRKATGT